MFIAILCCTVTFQITDIYAKKLGAVDVLVSKHF